MRTLLIDNHDSFTYNLFHLLAEVNGAEPLVARNDEATWEEIAGWEFDNVVLSPGPGRPERAGDFGVCAEAIRRAGVPLLGVCLGHQGLGWIAGGRVVHAPEPAHGRVATIRHTGAGLFAGIPATFRAVRYHSLCLREPLPAELEPIAWADDGVLMALAHRRLPRWGVQFHPESISSEHGRRLLANFRDLTARAGPAPARSGAGPGPLGAKYAQREQRAGVELELRVRRLDGDRDAEAAFETLYGDRGDAFWLDSSRVGEGARFSFIGAPGPLGATIAYDVDSGQVRIGRGAETELRRESIFDYLEGELRRLRLPAADLPFDFNCGFVGWFGYELKAESGGAAAHRAATADAAFLFADRLVAFDHEDGCAYLLCLATPGDGAAAERWLDASADGLAALSASQGREERPAAGDPVDFRLARSRERYLEDIAACKRALLEGESYEICLTNRIVAEARPAPLPLYRALRRANPAPFAAFLRVGETAVLSSSPERFLRIGAGGEVEAKPIKGTAPRGETAAEDARLAEALRGDEKNRAENLMIVDLLRNDLGRVCEVGSVEVPRLMEVESFETVHQLVSTARGRLREEVGPLECVRACFPPGSMTGAPKERTMAIVDELEGEARGVYSGAIGYLGLGGGCDLSVAIRTIVLDGEGRPSIGVGGAIVTGSDPEAEYEEALLKGWAPMRALDPTLPERYSRIRLSATTSRVTPRKSTSSAAAPTSAG
jgi:para-aminobenzoate synthetase